MVIVIVIVIDIIVMVIVSGSMIVAMCTQDFYNIMTKKTFP